MAAVRSRHRLGIALVVAAAVAWSTAPFFTPLLAFDSWTILFWRGLFGGALIAAVLVLTLIPHSRVMSARVWPCCPNRK
jgi:EamA domain-containing membrane protein RarD